MSGGQKFDGSLAIREMGSDCEGDRSWPRRNWILNLLDTGRKPGAQSAPNDPIPHAEILRTFVQSSNSGKQWGGDDVLL